MNTIAEDKVAVLVNVEMLENLTICSCGEESEMGCHGIRNDAVYSEYFCRSCYNRSKK